MMTSTIIWTIAVIAILGLVLAVVLYVVAEKFKVETRGSKRWRK